MEFVFGSAGSVTLQGVFIDLLVIGGTGCYAGTTGSVRLLDSSSDNVVYVFSDVVPECTDSDDVIGGPFIEEGGDAFVDFMSDEYSSGDLLVFGKLERLFSCIVPIAWLV